MRGTIFINAGLRGCRTIRFARRCCQHLQRRVANWLPWSCTFHWCSSFQKMCPRTLQIADLIMFVVCALTAKSWVTDSVLSTSHKLTDSVVSTSYKLTRHESDGASVVLIVYMSRVLQYSVSISVTKRTLFVYSIRYILVIFQTSHRILISTTFHAKYRTCSRSAVQACNLRAL